VFRKFLCVRLESIIELLLHLRVTRLRSF
jgi:hypothetical protein